MYCILYINKCESLGDTGTEVKNVAHPTKIEISGHAMFSGSLYAANVTGQKNAGCSS